MEIVAVNIQGEKIRLGGAKEFAEFSNNARDIVAGNKIFAHHEPRLAIPRNPQLSTDKSHVFRRTVQPARVIPVKQKEMRVIF